MKNIWYEIKWLLGIGWCPHETKEIGRSKNACWYVTVYRNTKTQEIRESAPWSPNVP